MAKEVTFEELKKENKELKQLLTKVLKAYDILNEELETYRAKTVAALNSSTVSNVEDVKMLLEKYSRL